MVLGRGAPVGGQLHANDAFEAQSSESVKTDDRIAQATGEEAGPQMLALVNLLLKSRPAIASWPGLRRIARIAHAAAG